MPLPLENLATLRDDMSARGWVVTCFAFTYKAKKYFVLVERYVSPRVAPEYQIVELTFVDQHDTNRTLTTGANRHRISAEARELREFFGIEFAQNLGDLLRQFCTQLGAVIPPKLPAVLAPDEQRAVLRQLDKRDGEEPGKDHCFDARRNGRRADGTPGKRSRFNS